jgi:hypothetical protein
LLAVAEAVLALWELMRATLLAATVEFAQTVLLIIRCRLMATALSSARVARVVIPTRSIPVPIHRLTP